MNPLSDHPLLLAYQDVAPTLEGPLARCGFGSAVLGRVTLGGGAILGAFAVLRGDGHTIRAGEDLRLGPHSTVHIAHALYGTAIGERVSVGAHTVVHGCTVGNDCVIEDQAVVLDGAVVGDGSVIASGSVVFPRSVLPAGHWCAGVPAVPIRPLGTSELAELRARVRAGSLSVPTSPKHDARTIDAERGAHHYVAASVIGLGELRMGKGSSVWFGCTIDAPGFGVTIDAGSNVQDNSVLRSTGCEITIGADCTIGHNVVLHDCTVGARVLIGMGSELAPGTVVPDDVLLAAGSKTTADQVLESGWMWGGRPAQPISRLDKRKLDLIRQSAVIYREYSAGFALTQADALQGIMDRTPGCLDDASRCPTSAPEVSFDAEGTEANTP